MVGWPNVDVAFGNPKAHFSFKAGTCSAVRPGSGWKRVFARSTPQPFQVAPPLGFGAPSTQKPERDSTAALTLERNSATVRRSLAFSAAPCAFILPVSSEATIASRGMRASASRRGARVVLFG